MARLTDARVVNIYIAEVAMKRKHCPNCEVELTGWNRIVSFGEYIHGSYRKWGNACRTCIDGAISSMIKPNIQWQCKVRSGCSVRWYKEF